MGWVDFAQADSIAEGAVFCAPVAENTFPERGKILLSGGSKPSIVEVKNLDDQIKIR